MADFGKGLSQNIMFSLGLVGIIIYLLYLKVDNYLGLAGLGALAYFFWQKDKSELKEITMEQAKDIAIENAKKSQGRGELPDGTIRLIPEKQINLFIVPTKEGADFRPYGYDIIVQVDTGNLPKYYLYSVSKFGTILGETQTKRKSIKELSEGIKTVKAPPEKFQRRERELGEDRVEKG